MSLNNLITTRSKFFSKKEIVVSSKHPELVSKIKPTTKELEVAALLIESVLHPLRLRFGPCRIDSWLRSYELNKAVGGASGSDHLYCSAVDPFFTKLVNHNKTTPVDPLEVFKYIYDNKLPVRQCIIYMYKDPIQLHLSINIPGREYKNDFLMSYDPGEYEFYN